MREKPIRISVGNKSALAMLTLLWLAVVVVVNPIGNFPLNDDWAYGWSVQNLLEKGDFQLSDWTAVNLVSQVVWGTLFCLPFGFSFTALRFSTLTLGFIGVLASYGVLREVKASPGLSLTGAVTVALNPLYFCLSNSFMSDVPSFSFTAIAFYWLIRALNRRSAGSLLAGIVASIVSTLNRQEGVIIVPAFALAHVIRHGWRLRSGAEALLISSLGIAVYLSYPRWLEATGRTPHLYDYQIIMILSSVSSQLPEVATTYAQNLFVMATYLGLFLLPFVLAMGADLLHPKTTAQPRTVVMVVLVGGIVGLWAAKYRCLPSAGNVLSVLGLGPSAIADTNGVDVDPLLLRRVWQSATVVAVVGAGILLLMLFKAFRAAVSKRTDRQSKSVCAFALATVVLFVLPIAALRPGYWFDRYLIALLPPLMVLCTMGKEAGLGTAARVNWGVVAAFTLVIFGLFTVTATHDYLSWNRHRWEVLNALVRERHIPPENVHGGFEFNGWFFGQRIETCNAEYRGDVHSPSWRDFSCIWNRPRSQYRVVPGPRENYRTAKRYSYRRWLPPVTQTFYLFYRQLPGE